MSSDIKATGNSDVGVDRLLVRILSIFSTSYTISTSLLLYLWVSESNVMPLRKVPDADIDIILDKLSGLKNTFPPDPDSFNSSLTTNGDKSSNTCLRTDLSLPGSKLWRLICFAFTNSWNNSLYIFIWAKAAKLSKTIKTELLERLNKVFYYLKLTKMIMNF